MCLQGFRTRAKGGAPMFCKVLIANRGEIAVRVIRACKELGIATVAVFSEADRDAVHVRMADEACYLGPSPAAHSYLSAPALITAATGVGADAIHPGYGFLAENPFFAEACAQWGMTFIGPRPDTIRAMGTKSSARALMLKAGVPVVPGTDEAVGDLDSALAAAAAIGYPVLVKAVGGGGGRGIRVARDDRDLSKILRHDGSTGRRPAAAGPTLPGLEEKGVYLEKYLEKARHIEVQILGDQHGHLVHLGERECSLQRRRQKFLEEAPAPSIPEDVRQAIRAAGVQAARAVGYSSAGTCEFLYDQSTGAFYFIEMNARIQVEHPVTEMVTGVDIVKAQVRVAAGEPLWFSQEDVVLHGHAIECRINAEDPDNRLLPSTGVIGECSLPNGPWTRLDSMVVPGFEIIPHYDSLIAKLIVWGQDRGEAIGRLRRALSEISIGGIKTTIPVHRRIVDDPDFLSADFHTTWLEEFLGLK